jgi:hypothetical protein
MYYGFCKDWERKTFLWNFEDSVLVTLASFTHSPKAINNSKQKSFSVILRHFWRVKYSAYGYEIRGKYRKMQDAVTGTRY